MADRVADPASSREYDEECPHRWVVELSTGAFSKGNCGKCGSTREFVNNVARHFYHALAVEGLASSKSGSKSGNKYGRKFASKKTSRPGGSFPGTLKMKAAAI